MRDYPRNTGTSDTTNEINPTQLQEYAEQVDLPFYIDSQLNPNRGIQAQDSEVDLRSLGFTSSPRACHAECRYSNTLETHISSHESQYQPQLLGCALDLLPQLTSSINPLWLDLSSTNHPHISYKQLPSTRSSIQIGSQDLESQVAQMQSNNPRLFAPTGRQRNATATYPALTHYLEQREMSGRPSLTPQLSYATTPESNFCVPQRQPIAMSAQQDLSAAGLQVATEESKIIQASQLDIKADPDVVRRFDPFGPPFHDWLSEQPQSEEWANMTTPQFARTDLQTTGYDQITGIFPRSPASKTPIKFSPSHIHTDLDNGIYSPVQVNKFEPAFARDLFNTPQTPDFYNNHFNNYSINSVQGHHVPQSYTYLTGQDYNQLPLYATTYPTSYLPFDMPQPHNLPSQNNNSQLTRSRSRKGRGVSRASDLDEKLVKWRNEGLTYREIMKKGQWGLEESTLRGRYRTLTKNKEDRLRKPTWDHASLSALVAAVDRFATRASNSPRTAEGLEKISWKKVAEWMHNEKGCYLYGNATTKKKYKELVGDQQMQWEVNQWRRANGESPI